MSTCSICSKTFKNLELHITKAHTKFTVERLNDESNSCWIVYCNDKQLDPMGDGGEGEIVFDYDHPNYYCIMLHFDPTTGEYIKLVYLKSLDDGSFEEESIASHRITVKDNYKKPLDASVNLETIYIKRHNPLGETFYTVENILSAGEKYAQDNHDYKTDDYHWAGFNIPKGLIWIKYVESTGEVVDRLFHYIDESTPDMRPYEMRNWAIEKNATYTLPACPVIRVIPRPKIAEEPAEEKKSTYTEYYKDYYQKNKAKIWEKTKGTEAYRQKYMRYYETHKAEVNRKRTERNRRKKELEKLEKEKEALKE